METFLQSVLGLDHETRQMLTGQMFGRALVVCLVMLVVIKLAGRRFLAQKNSFDALLAFLLASMMSRCINGSAPLGGTLATGLMMAALYRLFAWWTCRFHRLGRWLKGEPETLVENGGLRRAAMNRHHISENDLRGDVRLNAALNDLEQVKLACLERSGEISVLRQPQVVELGVKEGVQTVRVLLEG